MLVGHHLLFTFVFDSDPDSIRLFSLLSPAIHVRLVCTIVVLSPHPLLVDLLSQRVGELLVLRLDLVLLVDVEQLGLFILLDTLLNVFFLLVFAHDLAVVLDNFTHFVHLLLNATATVSNFLLTCLLFLKCNAHVGF